MDELLAMAAAVESSSEHPLAQAVVKAAFQRGAVPPGVTSFESMPGRGAFAEIDKHVVVVGSPAFLKARGVDLSAAAGCINLLEELGRTVIAVSHDRCAIGLLALGDTIRPGAAKAMTLLRQAGLRMVLLTGDNERAAQRVAQELGIAEVHAGVLPDGKAEVVRRLQMRGKVTMVGDGINDAPALMQADVGIAMGAGADIAIESADIIILSNRLETLATAREISRRSYGKMLQNVTVAFLFNGIGIRIAATGLVYPMWAMVAMAVSVTAIFINSLWEQPGLFIGAIMSVGRSVEIAASPVAT